MPILAGIIAALLSYILNKIILKKTGNKAIITIVPLIEESTKTASALILKTSVIKTHFIFGIIEGIYDIINTQKNMGKWAALASVISHTTFGALTQLTLETDHSIYVGLFLAWLLHSGLNWYVTKYL